MGLLVHFTDYEVTKIQNDINGNPRYAVHFFAFLNDRENNELHGVVEKYEVALRKARKIGGHKYHNKKFGGGISFQSYNIDETLNRIKELQQTYYKDIKK